MAGVFFYLGRLHTHYRPLPAGLRSGVKIHRMVGYENSKIKYLRL